MNYQVVMHNATKPQKEGSIIIDLQRPQPPVLAINTTATATITAITRPTNGYYNVQ